MIYVCVYCVKLYTHMHVYIYEKGQFIHTLSKNFINILYTYIHANIFNPKTVFWTNVGKIDLIYFLKILPLI